MSMITAQLNRLKDHILQVEEDPGWIEPPGHMVTRMPTLEDRHSVQATPMIQQRFSFAGSWKRAALGQDWLSVDEMKAAWTDAVIHKQLSRRRESDEGSVVAIYPNRRLSLFAIDLIGLSESYLVWPDAGGPEPRLVVHTGHHTYEFDNFQAYTRWLVEAF